MTCYHPKIRVEFQNQFITAKDGHRYKKAQIMSTDDYEKFKLINDELVNIQRIPCGNCIGCRLEYSKQWATRCELESRSWENNWFITLTYDNEHLEIPEEIFSKNTGEIYKNNGTWTGCLKPEHLTKFFKDLREFYRTHYNHTNIRFFACGEYGENFQRPHYHAIIFNLPITPDKLKLHTINENYQAIYECQELEKIWGKGFVSLGEVTFSSCAYVARYITKKQKGVEAYEEYLKKGQIPEFVRMSRKPGIGTEYYNLNKDKIYTDDSILQHTCKNTVLQVKPPRFYDKKLKETDPELMEQISQERRRAGENAETNKHSRTTKRINEQMKIDERSQLLKSKVLKRVL